MSKKQIISAVVILTLGGIARADFILGPPQDLGPVVNSASHDVQPSVSADGLTLYFASDRPGGFGGLDLWVATRSSVSAPWGPPVNLGAPVNSEAGEGSPSLSRDSLTLYFTDPASGGAPYRPGGLGRSDIWMTTRASPDDPWNTPVNLGAPINGPDGEISICVSADDLTLVFSSNRAGSVGYDLWMSTRPSAQESWGAPVHLGPTVNSPTTDVGGSLSADALALFFWCGREGGLGGFDLWMTTRRGCNAAWNAPVNLGPSINTAAWEMDPALSPDGRTLYFSFSPGSSVYLGDDLWQAPILPIVDFDSDGKVDLSDLGRLIDSWGQDDPAVDIGPYPWGDGRIDIEDLKVLLNHWTEDSNDPTSAAKR